VLSHCKLVTQRFGKLAAFDTVISGCRKAPPADATDAFLKILEPIVDQLAGYRGVFARRWACPGLVDTRPQVKGRRKVPHVQGREETSPAHAHA
jgi:hypothetical protein